jgi:molybdate transport system substrate-binding protein
MPRGFWTRCEAFCARLDTGAGSRRYAALQGSKNDLPETLMALKPRWAALLAVFLLLGSLPARASAIAPSSLAIAVAANFTAPAKELAANFQLATGNTLVLSFGASGSFFTQIGQGAPYEIFLSADAARPQKLVAMGLGVPGTCFSYATGKLVLWSAAPGFVDAQGKVLSGGKFTHIAIANPKSAPYGEAALETLKALGDYDSVAPLIGSGENITQAYQFVASGNAELGFVALSQVIKDKKGSAWLVPQNLYKPIIQDAVLLKPGADDAAARAFLAYLKTPEARAIIRSYGYATAP